MKCSTLVLKLQLTGSCPNIINALTSSIEFTVKRLDITENCEIGTVVNTVEDFETREKESDNAGQ